MGFCRFLLALSVLLVHLEVPVAFSGFGGANSVEAFYFVSGFLIASILRNDYQSWKNFYINRILRIFPMYWIVLLCTFLFAFLFSNGSNFLTKNEAPSFEVVQYAFIVLLNLFILGADVLVFLNFEALGNVNFVGFKNSQVTGTEYLLISPIWSVSLELTFYLIAPLLMKLSSRKILIVTLVLLITRIALYLSQIDDDPWTYRFFPFELPIFLMGVLVSRFSYSKIGSERGAFMLKLASHPLFFTIAFLAFGIYRSKVSFPRPLELFVLLFIISIILIYSKNGEPSNSIGRYSYPIYIVHYPVIFFLQDYRESFLSNFATGNTSNTSWIVLQILVVIILSHFLIAITLPIEKIRNRLRS
ncbi:COG1835 Predicted acyltransferases [Candidatus Nanopelagicaceae bacterium]